MLNSWFIAIRPKTLPASLAPVLIGSAMAFGDGIFNPLLAIACLLGALFIQIGTNLANDYFDCQKGADQERVGPMRVTQAGLIPAQTVLWAAILFFVLAAFISVFLYFKAGFPIAIIAISSIICGFLYTAGKKPLGYLGLGELFVFIFFGPVAVAGTYYVQTLEMNTAVLLAGFAPGFFSCGILAINNLRDLQGDSKVGKRTLAVRLGPEFAAIEYLFCILAAMLIPFLVLIITSDHRWISIASMTGFLAMGTVHKVMTTKDPAQLNKALAHTGIWLALYSILFSIGWILDSF